ncbi:hypothetical protein MKK84_06960 [Methylobacterium sp. E-065]|uniref:hypothetical protein n=1 Tax=Methylobacterium sp. E-065 TaxID=2836583 RepID=UPI001FBA1B82|nr:hypothetical protein [Methylobacterium sp. E-065]MCJ2017163.1 hypothetical protein [Methylobacterium sp. E-065]
MADNEDEKGTGEAFRADVARAFGAISGAMEVMQAHLFMTRAVIELLQERDLLQIADVRERAQVMARAAGLAAKALAALDQLLDEDGLAVPQVLN